MYRQLSVIDRKKLQTFPNKFSWASSFYDFCADLFPFFPSAHQTCSLMCVTLLCVRFKWVMVQRSKHVDALLSPDAISLPHVPSSVAFFLRNSWRLKVAAWIGWTSSIYMEESTVVQLLLELWTSAFKNMTPCLPCFSSLSIRFHPLTFRHHSCRWIHPVIQKEKN